MRVSGLSNTHGGRHGGLLGIVVAEQDITVNQSAYYATLHYYNALSTKSFTVMCTSLSIIVILSLSQQFDESASTSRAYA